MPAARFPHRRHVGPGIPMVGLVSEIDCLLSGMCELPCLLFRVEELVPRCLAHIEPSYDGLGLPRAARTRPDEQFRDAQHLERLRPVWHRAGVPVPGPGYSNLN
jgi:hypothetical protein